MVNSCLNNLLVELDLIANDAIFLSNEKGKWNVFSHETKAKLSKISPDAVYAFNNSPYILFFDLTNNQNLEREREIHKQVWSFDQAPLMFVVKGEEVKIYNAFAYEKKVKEEESHLQEIKLGTEETRKEIFSFWKLQSGDTWKWLQSKYYENKKLNDSKKRVHQKLFDNIKQVREKLSSNLSDEDANTLILRLIFIRYLIDRNVKIDPKFIQGEGIIEKRISFSSLIRNAQELNSFFVELNRIFNGVLFKEELLLTTEQSNYLANVFNEKDDFENLTLFDNTEFYFNVFDFNIIPVELISGIYESLISPETREADSAFYTPLFLVEHILTQTIDKFLDDEKSECKIFDPAVGSGIFLVQSFRRMVEREKALTGKTSLTKDRLSEIATKNLWGTDINPEALKVARFSIYIAILDYEEPGSIMDKFHFGDLNLYHADFFETDPNHILNTVIKNEKFCFILGNPPWKKDKSPIHLEWINKNDIYEKKVTGEIEIAQDFLLRAREFMSDNTVCSLVVTSPIFYNISSTSKIFRDLFLNSVDISNILDLSPVRRYIFEGKKVEIDKNTGKKKSKSISNPALVITFQKTVGNFRESLIEHTSVKSNIFTKLYKTLVIEKFDRKNILQKHFIDNNWMFKVALYGNTLDYLLLKKLGVTNNKIIDIVDNKSIFSGAGIKSNLGKDYADFLIGLPLVENKDVIEYYTPIDSSNRKLREYEVYYESGRRRELFYGNKILIKEQARNESELVISYVENDCAYKNGIWCLCSTNKETIKLNFSYLLSDLYTYYIFITSCAWGVSTRPQIRLDEEYLSFPFLESNQKGELIKLVDQFLEPLKNHYAQEFPMGNPPENKIAKDKINQIIEKTYQIKGYEKDLIDYVLDVSRYQFQESKQNKILRRVSTDDNTIKAYTDIFFSELEPIYSDEFISVEVYNLDHFIALNFVFSNEKLNKRIIEGKGKDEKIVLEKIAKTASISQISKDIFIQKDIKGFEENSFYIIKPNEYKCWHRAMAWYDVAEIKEAIQTAELDRLKN